MVIRPSNPEPSRRTPASGLEATPTQPALPRERVAESTPPPTPLPQGDRAEVSSAARALFESALQPAIGGSTMAPERMRGVLERVRTGHYDRPDVLDRIAERIQSEVTGTPDA